MSSEEGKVGYSDDGRDSLYAVWQACNFEQRVIDASYVIEERLTADPIGNGQPLAEGLWSIEVAPLRCLYEFVGPEAEVQILKVSQLPGR